MGYSLTRLVFRQRFHGNIWERKSHTEILSGLTYFTMPALIKLLCTESVKGTSLLISSSAQPVEKLELKNKTKTKTNKKTNQGLRLKILPWFLYWTTNFRFRGQQDCLYTHQLQVSLFSHVALVAFINTTTRALVLTCCISCIHATTTRALVLPCCTGCIHATTTRALVLPCCIGCSHTTMTCSHVLHWLQSHNNDKCPGLFARVALAAVTQMPLFPRIALAAVTQQVPLFSHVALAAVTQQVSLFACVALAAVTQQVPLFSRVALVAVTQQRHVPLFSCVALAAFTQQWQVPLFSHVARTVSLILGTTVFCSRRTKKKKKRGCGKP